MIRLCRQTGCAVHVVHFSSADSLPQIRDAKAEGLPITVQTCAHYLCLFAEGIDDGDFVVTLPKVTVVDQLRALDDLLTRLELRLGLPDRAIGVEFMVEVPSAVFDATGCLRFPELLTAAGPRLVGVHLGVYDHTAGCGIAARDQAMDHPACDFVRSLMMLAFGGRGIMLSAGSTSVLPVGPHPDQPALSPPEVAENRPLIHAA